ncbi:MAG TPA: hypothetical protein VKA34_14705 [Balneolales bacterium]|nr:hypothetical protein [Balneolales bacterium]
MADLTVIDRRMLEDLFNMGGGYVLDFTNDQFAAFFRDFNIDIYQDRYFNGSGSKAKRLRAFWELESNQKVGEVLDSLMDYVEAVKPSEAGELTTKHREITDRLLHRKSNTKTQKETAEDFLDKQFGEIDLSLLGLDPGVESAIKQRIKEIQISLANKASLAVIFLAGSTLEGLLLNAALNDPKSFNKAKAAPFNDSGKVRPFPDWSLNHFINVAHELGVIGLDVKKFSHSLRGFRNYIHPYQQAQEGFKPDNHTAEISWQVLRAAISDLTGKR